MVPCAGGGGGRRRGGPVSRTGASAGIIWFRRDLRLSDNPALRAAFAACRTVVPLFVWDPALVHPAGAPRLTFLRSCLEDLDCQIGGGLVVRAGDPLRVVPELAGEVGAGTVWCAEDFGPHGRARDDGVASRLSRTGVRLVRVGSSYAVAPGQLRTGQGRPYQVFTPYRRQWLRGVGTASGPAPGGRPISEGHPERSPGEAARYRGEPAPAGEAAAHRRLDLFMETAADRYDRGRDDLGSDGTSRLSAYLKFGCLHPRQVLDRLDPTCSGHEQLATELCWRDFYADVLFHRPDSARSAYRREWSRFRVDRGPSPTPASARGPTVAPATRSWMPACASSSTRAG